MGLSVEENRALKRALSIVSPTPFGGTISVQPLESGAQAITGTLRSGVVTGTRVVGADGSALTSKEALGVETPVVRPARQVVPTGELLEQSRTLVAQFTSDGTTGDIVSTMGSSPFNGNIISAQVEVSEAAAGSAALAVRTENGQSVFQGAGLTEGGVLDLSPDFVAVGLFADPLFVPVSRVPLIAGEGVELVMRLAGGVPAGGVRALVSVTLQGVGMDLSKEILAAASVPPPSPAAAIASSPAPTPLPGIDVGPSGIVSALVRFSDWVVGQKFGLPISLGGALGSATVLWVPVLSTQFRVAMGPGTSVISNIVSGEVIRGVWGVRTAGPPPDFGRVDLVDVFSRRQFLTGPASAFRALPENAEVEIVTDSFALAVFRAGGIPMGFEDELGSALRVNGMARWLRSAFN